MNRTKISYVITHGLAPYFLGEVFKAIDGRTELVIGFDETLNKITQRQQMDISIRFWNDTMQRVESKYVGSAFLASSRASDLLKGLKQSLERNPDTMHKVLV